jgi:predicted metal-dependent TIM-barrel fold hydrolase
LSQSAVNLSFPDDPNKSVIVSVSGIGHVLEAAHWFQRERSAMITKAVVNALKDSGGPSYLTL